MHLNRLMRSIQILMQRGSSLIQRRLPSHLFMQRLLRRLLHRHLRLRNLVGMHHLRLSLCQHRLLRRHLRLSRHWLLSLALLILLPDSKAALQLRWHQLRRHSLLLCKHHLRNLTQLQ